MTPPATPPAHDVTDPTSTGSTGCGSTCRHRASYAASRRAVLGGVAAVASVPVLAACGSSSGDSGSDSGSDSSDSGDSGGSADGIAASDVPVGSGTIYEADKIVVTQPTEGDFKAFSAVCTHQGCLVSEVSEEGITCTCHGSVFSLEDGSPQSGPADEALAAKTVTADGDTLTVS